MRVGEIIPGRHYACRVKSTPIVKALYVSVGDRVFVRDASARGGGSMKMLGASKLLYEVARDGDRWRPVGNRRVVKGGEAH